MNSAGALALFALAAVALYGKALDNPYHFDDLHSIRHNPHIRSLARVPDFFVDLHTFSSERAGTMFRPLLLCSYALNYALHGYDVRGYRLFNLALHALCAWLVFLLVRQMRGGEMEALAAGLLFLAHPLQAEAVNYISSRSDMLAACFALAGVLAFASAHRWSGRALFVSFAAGLLVKSIAITLPLLCLVRLRGARLQEIWSAHRGRLAGLAALALLYVGIIAANQFLPSSLAKVPRPFGANTWTQFKALAYSSWLFALPVDLNVDHPFAVARAPWEAAVWPAALFVASSLFVGLRLRGSRMGAGLLWFFAALVPYVLVPLNIVVSERRLYLASAGLALALGWALARFLQRRRRWAIPLCAGLALSFAATIGQRNAVWSSAIALWEDAVGKGEAQPRARVNLALAYGRAGRWAEARKQLRAALAADENFADAWVELGNIEHREGALAAARKAYERALAVQPALAGAHYNLGNIHMAQQEAARAKERYEIALRLNPNFAMAHNNLGQALERLGDEARALAEYRAALEIDPHLPQAWYNLASLLERQGEDAEAMDAYGRAEELLRADEKFAGDPQYRDFARRARQRREALQRAGD